MDETTAENQIADLFCTQAMLQLLYQTTIQY